MPRPRSTLRTYPQNGFALLITVTLLAFLVLLLVALASLTRVETQVAGNSQQLSKARQNALFALNLALGELQKYAGPDQRITAPADLLASTDRAGAATPAPAATAIATQPGTRRWTGVWGNSQPAIGYDLRPDQISGRGITPTLLNWLVSGNEKTTYTLNSNGKGGVTAGPAPAFTPVAPLATSIELVGEATAGADAQDKVSVPLVNLYTPAGLTPGADPSTAPLTGRYAWWVGDEGVKARVNLQPGYVRSKDPADQINAFITSHRSAFELMDRDNATQSTPATPINATADTNFDFTDVRITNIATPRQLALLKTTNTVLATASKARFHDVTTWSAGVLSDTYAGGLKKDLTADIVDSSAAAGHNPAGNRPADNEPLFKTLKNNSEIVPTWGHLRSWARLKPNSSGAIEPVLPSDTAAGFYPMLMYASLGLDVYVDGAAPPHSVHAAFFPVVLLNNPYPVSIAASRYRIGFKFSASSHLVFRTAIVPPTPDPLPPPPYSPPSKPDAATGTVVGIFDIGTPALRSNPNPSGDGNLVYFVIDCPEIPPGETHAYRLEDAESPYSPGLRMVRFPPSAGSMPTGLTNHAYLDTSISLPTSITTTDRLHMGQRMPDNSAAPFGCAVFFGPDADIADPANRYQDYTSITVLNGALGTTQSGVPFLISTPTSRQTINGAANWYFPGGTNGARAALRMTSPMEGGQQYSTSETAGLGINISRPPPQLPITGLPGIAWLRHGNMRAPHTRRTTMEAGTYGTGLMGIVLANDKIDQSYRTARSVELVPNLTGYATGIMGTDDDGILRRMTLFDILESPDRLLSLGQLQNAPFARYGFHPAYPFANAMADIRLPRTVTYAGTNADTGNKITRPDGSGISDPIYDLSWHLNRALWDRYFVSGVPLTWTQADIDAGRTLPNARHRYYSSASTPLTLDSLRYTSASGAPNKAYDEAASHLMVAGAFNINSTSEQAWRALLGGPLGLSRENAVDYAFSTSAGDGDRVDEIVPFPRFSRNLSRPDDSPAGYKALPVTMTSDSILANNTFRSTFYHGNRGLWLTDRHSQSTNTSATAVINELARCIVQEIRTRGPFLSLADFVNRPILSSKQDIGIKGALQAAIDGMTTVQANPYARWKNVSTPIEIETTYAGLPTNWDHEHYLGGPVTTNGNRESSPGNSLRIAFGPKYLTQADVLSTLGPQLSARSDTFTIRTYGESLVPATQEIQGRAWCEAVVQRVPDYIDNSPTPVAATNATWGRRFKIVSFRWLTPQDL